MLEKYLTLGVDIRPLINILVNQACILGTLSIKKIEI